MSNRGVGPTCAANSLLFTVHSCLSKCSKCISTAQARRIWVSTAGASRDCALVVAPNAFSDITFRGRHTGKPRALVVQSRLFVTGARDRSGLISW